MHPVFVSSMLLPVLDQRTDRTLFWLCVAPIGCRRTLYCVWAFIKTSRGRRCVQGRCVLTCFCQGSPVDGYKVLDTVYAYCQCEVAYFYGRQWTALLRFCVPWRIFIRLAGSRYSSLRQSVNVDGSPLHNTWRWRTRLLKYFAYDSLAVLAALSALFRCFQKLSSTLNFVCVGHSSPLSSAVVYWAPKVYKESRRSVRLDEDIGVVWHICVL